MKNWYLLSLSFIFSLYTSAQFSDSVELNVSMPSVMADSIGSHFTLTLVNKTSDFILVPRNAVVGYRDNESADFIVVTEALVGNCFQAMIVNTDGFRKEWEARKLSKGDSVVYAFELFNICPLRSGTYRVKFSIDSGFSSKKYSVSTGWYYVIVKRRQRLSNSSGR